MLESLLLLPLLLMTVEQDSEPFVIAVLGSSYSDQTQNVWAVNYKVNNYDGSKFIYQCYIEHCYNFPIITTGNPTAFKFALFWLE